MGLFLDWQFKFVGAIFRISFCPLSRVYGFLSFTCGLVDTERCNNDLSHWTNTHLKSLEKYSLKITHAWSGYSGFQ